MILQNAQVPRDAFEVQDAIGKLWEKLGGWLDAVILKLPNFILAIILLIIFYFIAKGLAKFSRKVLFKKLEQESIRQMLSKLTFAITFIIGFFIALSVLELDKALTSVLAGAGVVGLAIGLALQGTLSNSVSGLVLSFIPNVRIGDYVETNDKSGFVTEITLRSIVIRQPNNEYVVMPNSKFVDEPFTNYSLTERSRISVSCGVGYESDLQMVEDITTEIIGQAFEQKGTEEIEFFFTEFGDSSINFEVRFWIDCTAIKAKKAATHKAVKIIKARFDKENINIPFPIRTLDFGKNNLQIVKNSKE
ncbi:mechanosensitive ion channel family protein [Dokdonia sinensis]|uniref:Mechanosensitive ion channel family protein n=1 Tax=Dokdonia sinensis TaxID=2479847 RepID=A0A3M0GE07_9FLAO|nr:mechanosensitive ion channel family protein [Dokdonia sinensis]RMB60872.1 mechanosensitive ion channel family protein [Dokdonia sinensis]